MKPLLLILLGACLISSATVLAREAAKAEASVAVFEKLLAEKAVAIAHGDGKTYASFVAPDALFVDDYGVVENAAQHIATIGHRPVGRSRYTVDDVHVSAKPGFAVVSYHTVEHVTYGPGEVATGYRVVETYIDHDGQWLILAHSEAQVAIEPPPQKVPQETLQDYVGQYEWWPGYVDTISRDGDKLYSQGTGDTEKTLNHAATPESFYFVGEPNIVVFARDRTGKVTHYVLHWSDGHVTVARKIK